MFSIRHSDHEGCAIALNIEHCLFHKEYCPRDCLHLQHRYPRKESYAEVTLIRICADRL